MQKIAEIKAKGIVNTRYSMTFVDVYNLIRTTESDYELVMDGFYYGYAQGMKAQKARDKKKQKKKKNNK